MTKKGKIHSDINERTLKIKRFGPVKNKKISKYLNIYNIYESYHYKLKLKLN